MGAVKQERSGRTHELVLDAAAAEFAQYGYASANLQNVADRTGLTKGAVYGHFASKKELAEALVEHLGTVTGELLAAAGAGDGPALQQLRCVVADVAERLQSDLRARAALRLVTEDAHVAKRLPVLTEDLFQVALSLAERADGEGTLSASVSPKRVADLMVVMLFGVLHTTPYGDRWGAVERVNDLCDALVLCIEGVPKEGSEQPAAQGP
ncbi:TetR family transcriptional regulator [Streptomyces sp. NPDC058221]|uniref:TetR family transcriptional regulator n=1 Tax=Streptomyces sp. NPDC058221 TaxID=3346388 RepID=UPI0036EBEF1E